MLNTYLTSTQRLLQNPAAPTSLYATADLTSYINTARGQLAGEGECIRFQGSLTLAASTRVYNFSAITISNAAIQGVINLRQALYAVGQGYAWLRPRGFEWFTLYHLNNPVPPSGAPKIWSQYGQGANSSFATGGGSIYVDPVPDQPYTLLLDCVCYPIPLVDDTTAEAIPYLWTDAVPYFAAYMALMAAQAQARLTDANRMFDRYTDFVNRARRFATPSVLGQQYPQQPNLTRAGQLGLSPPRAAGGGG